MKHSLQLLVNITYCFLFPGSYPVSKYLFVANGNYTVIRHLTLFEKDIKPVQNQLYVQMINVRVLTLSREQCFMKAWSLYMNHIFWTIICAKSVEGNFKQKIFHLLIFDVHLQCNSPINTNFITNQFHNIYVYYAMLLHVATIHLCHFRGEASLIDVYNIYGNLSQIIGSIYTYT